MYQLIKKYVRTEDAAFGAERLCLGISSRGGLGPRQQAVEFTGRSETDCKRAMLRYWTAHRQQLELDLKSFTRRCTISDGGRRIVFWPPQGYRDQKRACTLSP